MLDQSFSVDNFQRIVDLANRKGVHVEDKLSMDAIKDFNEQIRECNSKIKLKRRAGDEAAVKALYETKKEIRENKNSALRIELERISQRIAEKSFKIQLEKSGYSRS